MEVKDLVALSEQHMRTPSFSEAWDSLRTCLPCLCTGRTQFSTALKALRCPFKDQSSFLFNFCATCFLPLCRAFYSAGSQIYSAGSQTYSWPAALLVSPVPLHFGAAILCIYSSSKCSVRSWLTFLQRKCSRQEKYEVTGNPKNDWDRTRKMGSHGSSLTCKITYRRMQELRPCGLFGLWHLYNNKPTG